MERSVVPYRHLNDLEPKEMFAAIVVFVISGLINFLRRDLRGKPLYKRLYFFVQDTVASGSLAVFAGSIVLAHTDNFIFALGAGGIVGHIGTRSIYILELIIAEKTKSNALKEHARENLRDRK